MKRSNMAHDDQLTMTFLAVWTESLPWFHDFIKWTWWRYRSNCFEPTAWSFQPFWTLKTNRTSINNINNSMARITITMITPNNFHLTPKVNKNFHHWNDIQEAAQSSTVRGAAFAQLIKVGETWTWRKYQQLKFMVYVKNARISPLKKVSWKVNHHALMGCSRMFCFFG